MRTAAEEVSTNGLVDTKRAAGLAKRRNWPEAFKCQVVAETLEPGSSVSIVARRHDLNTNQLFKWRRELLAKEPPTAAETNLVPVEIVAAPERRPPRRRVERAGSSSAAARGCAFVARLCRRLCGRSSSCCDDRLAGGDADLAGGGHDRHAQRLRQPGDASPERLRQGSVLGPRVLLPRAARRSGEAVVVGWRRAVPVCQAAGAWPLHLAARR